MIGSLFRLSPLMLLLLAAALVRADDKKGPAQLEMSKDEKKLLELLNEERAKADLPALKPHPLLFKAARAHSANMAEQEKLLHVLDGKRPAQRVEAAGYNWGKVAENIAVSEGGEPSLSLIVKSWMESKTHRENLLSNGVSETGLGIARNAKGEIYYTQVFARPRKIKKN